LDSYCITINFHFAHTLYKEVRESIYCLQVSKRKESDNQTRNIVILTTLFLQARPGLFKTHAFRCLLGSRLHMHYRKKIAKVRRNMPTRNREKQERVYMDFSISAKDLLFFTYSKSPIIIPRSKVVWRWRFSIDWGKLFFEKLGSKIRIEVILYRYTLLYRSSHTGKACIQGFLQGKILVWTRTPFSYAWDYVPGLTTLQTEYLAIRSRLTFWPNTWWVSNMYRQRGIYTSYRGYIEFSSQKTNAKFWISNILSWSSLIIITYYTSYRIQLRKFLIGFFMLRRVSLILSLKPFISLPWCEV